MLILEVVRRKEDDRNMLSPPALLNQARQLDAIDFRHLNIQHNGCDLLTHQRKERLIPVLSGRDRVAFAL